MFKKKHEEKIETTETADVTKGEDKEEELEELEAPIPEETKIKKKKLPNWVIIPVLAVLGVAAFIGMKFSEPTTKTKSLEVVKVSKGDVKEVYHISGTVKSEQMKVFYSPVNAQVTACVAKVGELVKAGDLLVTFDTKDLEKANQESKLQALTTEYSNQASVEQQRRTESQAVQVRRQIAEQISSIKQQISAKAAEVAQLESQLSNASNEMQEHAKKVTQLKQQMQANLDAQDTQGKLKTEAETNLANVDTLYPTLSAPDKLLKKQELTEAINTATGQIADLKIAYRAMETQLNALGTGGSADSTQTAYATATQELQVLRSSLAELQKSNTTSADTGMTNGQVKGMRVAENLAELSVLSAAELVAKGQEGMKAEFDGVIADVKALVGSSAVQGGEMYTIASNNNIEIILEIPTNDYEKVVLNNMATIQTGTNTYRGKVTQVNKIATQNTKGNSVIGATVHVENPDDNICIGVTAKLVMTVAEKKDVLSIPIEVVNTSAKGDFAYVIEQGVVKKKMIELGVSSGKKIEVLDGLKEGEEVVVDTLGTVKEGMKAEAVLKDAKDL